MLTDFLALAWEPLAVLVTVVVTSLVVYALGGESDAPWLDRDGGDR